RRPPAGQPRESASEAAERVAADLAPRRRRHVSPDAAADQQRPVPGREDLQPLVLGGDHTPILSPPRRRRRSRVAPMNPVSLISGLRASIGVGAWLAPNLTGRAFGLDPDGNPQASYLARLFAIRDLALAAGTLGSEGDARRRWIQLGLACDLADAAAAYLAGRDGTL